MVALFRCNPYLQHHRNALLLKLLITFCLFVAGSLAQTTFYLDGTPSAYLQFPSWQYFFAKHKHKPPPSQQTSNTLPSDEAASFSFDFKCSPPAQLGDGSAGAAVGGLLLYADDQSSGVFLEVKLLSESTLRLRVDDRLGAVRTRNIIELQRQEINFTDGQWHRFELIRHLAQPIQGDTDKLNQPNLETSSADDYVESITLKVDSEVIHKKIELSSSSNDRQNHLNKQSVFMGGLPSEYHQQQHHHHHHQLPHLALATAAYELHFRGAIRNVLYASAAPSGLTESSSTDLRMQQPLVKHGLLSEEEDKGNEYLQQNQCTKSSSTTTLSKCAHGGHCYPIAAGGVYCDCSATDYEGPFCQRGKCT